MGAAASLFYSANDPEKQTLTRRCSPSTEQFEEQQDRWNGVADHLVADLKERSGYPIRTWLQGSYKFGTQIRPVRNSEEFDIDLGVYFQWSGKPEDGDHSPKHIKHFVNASLKAFAAANADEVKEVCPVKTRCSRIRHNNGFHIDVPSYHLDTSTDARSLATEDGWEESNPKAIYLWFRDSFDEATRARVRRQIRYFKTWAALKFAVVDSRPSSIMLTVLVTEAALDLESDTVAEDDVTFRNLVAKVIARLGRNENVPNPVAVGENLNRLSGDHSTAFLDHLKVLHDVANRALDVSTELAAADVWQEAFEHMFPMPAIELAATMNAVVPTFAPKVKVIAVSRTNRSAAAFTGLNKIGPIPKDCDLTFEVTNIALMPPGSWIVWIVRNEGREAELLNDLGHSTQSGPVAYEHSAYKGTHSMDCIVKGPSGRTAAIRRVPVTIGGADMPRRNPLRRPEWTKLRGRR